MSQSLKDQLLKAGLGSKPAKTQSKKKKQAKVAKSQRKTVSETTLRAQRAMLKKAKKDKQLNELRQREAEVKAKHAQIKQLVDASKLSREEGDTPYSFTLNKKVKKIYVTEEQQQQLSKDQIVIISMGNEAYELVPKVAAQKIAERDSRYVVANAANKVDNTSDDDPYADYQVPDDLTW